MLRASALALLVLLAGCDPAREGTLPVVQIVGADLRYVEPGNSPTLDVWPKTREVDRIPAPPCDSPYADCAPGEVTNAILPEQTRLVADRDVRVSNVTVKAGEDVLTALDDLARLQLSVYPFAVAGLRIGSISLPEGRTRLTASWETDDGLAFSSTVAVSR